jgi:DNA-binding response OmpR family regulator
VEKMMEPLCYCYHPGYYLKICSKIMKLRMIIYPFYDDVLTNTSSNCQNRIMIVDDEHDIARLFAITLERNGFIVDVFYDPLSALSNYKAGYYDLLLLDIKMPGMSGFELYQKIKGKDDKAKVCFITAYEEHLKDFKRLFPNLGEVDCFVRKPIEMHDLVKLVKSKLDYI